MKKKICVNFSAHYSVVVELNESEYMYDEAVELAEQYVQGNPSIIADWEVDDVDVKA